MVEGCKEISASSAVIPFFRSVGIRVYSTNEDADSRLPKHPGFISAAAWDEYIRVSSFSKQGIVSTCSCEGIVECNKKAFSTHKTTQSDTTF